MKDLNYLSQAIKKRHKQTCKVNNFDGYKTHECFNTLIEAERERLLDYLKKDKKFLVGSTAVSIGNKLFDLAYLNITKDYQINSIDWKKIILGLEYLFVGNKIINGIRPNSRLNSSQINIDLCLTAAAILMNRKDMIRFYFSNKTQFSNVEDINLPLYGFLKSYLNDTSLKNSNIFSTSETEDMELKLSSLLEQHKSNSKYTNKLSPYFTIPFDTLPVHVFLWLKKNKYKDNYGLHEAIINFQKHEHQYDELLLKLEIDLVS